MHRRIRASCFAAALLIASAGSVRAQADLINQARRLDLQGKPSEAIALYQKALDTAPGSFDAHYGMARALDLAGRYPEARDHFAKAIGTAPDADQHDQASRMMGVSYLFTGDTARATPYFQEVHDRRLAAGNLAGAAEEANELARVYLETGDLANAERWYATGYAEAGRQTGRTTLDVDLAEMRRAHAAARIAARKGDLVEARRQQAIVKALVDKPDNAGERGQYAYLAGYVAFYARAYDEAIAALSQADQGDPFILVLLAQADEAAGHADAARDAYQKVLASTSHAINNAFARPIAERRRAALKP